MKQTKNKVIIRTRALRKTRDYEEMNQKDKPNDYCSFSTIFFTLAKFIFIIPAFLRKPKSEKGK